MRARHILSLTTLPVMWAMMSAGLAAQVAVHGLLSDTHRDTAAESPARGDLIVADAARMWRRQALCQPNWFVGSNGTDTVCSNDGSRLIQLNASSLFSGTIPEARLSDNVARLNGQNLTFNPGNLGRAVNTTWAFKTATDDAIATLLVSSEGTTVGATPNGFAQLQVNAQTEVPNPPGRPVGSNMSGYFRVMAKTFNGGTCRGTMCPDMAELASDHDLRFTVSGMGTMSFVKNNSPVMLIDDGGHLRALTFTHVLSPRIDMITDTVALEVDTTATPNSARNIGLAVTSGNVRGGGETAIKVLPLSTDGQDYGIQIEAQTGVEYPLAVRSGPLDRLLVCGDGGLVVGLGCAASKGAGTINYAGDVYKNGEARGLFDQLLELRQQLDRLNARIAALEQGR